MSPGWLLLPFSELVLSSLPQLFMAGKGKAQEFTHPLLGDVCLSSQPHLRPSACDLVPQLHFFPDCKSHAADLGIAVDPLESLQNTLKEGAMVFPSFFSLLPLIF